MIPVELELTNFLSYRDTAVLDFGGIHLAGISGPNGAGKSSIMEAMTWALFGQSRVRSDDDLVNRQADDDGAAEVRFTFKLEDLIYRVIRRKRPGKTMILELQMDAGDGGWKPLSEGKIRDTQNAIEALLQMNYDTFINASFLLQGKADQFTTRTPGQRKEILAELLGVTQWEQYRDRAAAARKGVEGNIALVDGRLDDIAAELEEEPLRSEALENAKAARQIIVEKRELKELLLNETRINEETRKQQEKNIIESGARVERMLQNLQSARANLGSRHERREQLAAIIEHAGEIQAAFASWQAAEKEVQTLQTLAQEHNVIVQAMRPFEMEIAETRSRLEQERLALQERAKRVETSEKERQALKEALAEAEKRLAALQEESAQLDQLQVELTIARESLHKSKGERKLWQQELATLESQAGNIAVIAAEKTTMKKNKDEAEALIISLSDRLSVINEQKETFSQLQIEKQSLEAQQPSLRREMDKLSERIETLETADLAGACPLCDQPLSEDHRHSVLESLHADGKRYGDNYRENKTRLNALEVEIPQVEKTILQASPMERDRQTHQRRLAQADARLQEIARAEEEWSANGEKRLLNLAASLADESDLKRYSQQVDELEISLDASASLREKLQALQGQVAGDSARLVEIDRLIGEWETSAKSRLTDVEERLKSEDFAAEARSELSLYQERLQVIGYDPAAHQLALTARDKDASAPTRHQELREAQAALEPLESAIDDLEKQISEQEIELELQRSQLAEAKKQLAILQAEGIDLKALEREVFQLREEELNAVRQVGAAQQKLDILNDLRDLRKDMHEQKADLSLRVQRLTILEKSCSRKGVQALLIEHALPEIEEGANGLLDRLTGGEMRIKFDTQRKLKSRDATAETLDIIISDRAGERPYDNYSGGEQFRINFAIRLALSQLLANRSGARLQTLVVDEGFGSQDPQGRQRLIEAINAIQDDFACILVITHIDELREAFPTRIEVQKELSGSTITVQ